ncbi:hypothetical protein [Nocardia sp. CDC160]|uniref:hypothetical protein n=1 Tax=Nocardia sp. CDC160 TaxID=3112166 RepID=UPI002DBDBE14|nr:hypothetical protein [Nocardia sp. CDC160]MEC3919665.1 hypothetical protein [Nocardia sp. CDC160]
MTDWLGSFAACCAITFAAVLAFAIAVMLVVATGCGDHVATDPPGSGSTSQPLVAGGCQPFCPGTTTSGPRSAS